MASRSAARSVWCTAVNEKSFFDYLKEEIAQSEFTKKLDSEVERVRASQELRVEYMSMLAELEDTREEGREESREEGREQNAITMLKDNLALDKVILYSGVSEARVLELQKSLTENE